MILPDWHGLVKNLFDISGDNAAVSVVEKILRPVAVYLLLVFTLRGIGKRILAQLNPFDLVVLLTLSNTVQNAIIGDDTSLFGGVIGAAALLAINGVLLRIYYRGPKMEHRQIDTQDTYLIRNHKIQEKELLRLHINVGELTARAHERGFDDLDEVESAVLYPNGTIYMKGTSKDDACLHQILREVQALRREVASQRG